MANRQFIYVTRPQPCPYKNSTVAHILANKFRKHIKKGNLTHFWHNSSLNNYTVKHLQYHCFLRKKVHESIPHTITQTILHVVKPTRCCNLITVCNQFVNWGRNCRCYFRSQWQVQFLLPVELISSQQLIERVGLWHKLFIAYATEYEHNDQLIILN